MQASNYPDMHEKYKKVLESFQNILKKKKCIVIILLSIAEQV